MKKLITGMAAIAAIFVMSGTTSFAAQTLNPHNYVDMNGDGICDYCNVATCAFVDINGDGICDNYGGTHCLHGAYYYNGTVNNAHAYADMNGDGICDYCNAAACAFVDLNGDGICDNYGGGHCGHGGYCYNGTVNNAHNYVDMNGDGICDYCNAAVCAFVDANGDGICDNYGGGHCGHGGYYYNNATAAGTVRHHGGCGGYGYGRRGHH